MKINQTFHQSSAVSTEPTTSAGRPEDCGFNAEGGGGLNRIDLVLSRGKWRVHVKMVMEFRVRKMWVISWLDEEVSAYQKGVCSMELVRKFEKQFLICMKLKWNLVDYKRHIWKQRVNATTALQRTPVAYGTQFYNAKYQNSETNVMYFLFSLLWIKGLYIFRALLAHPQEALHKRHFI
jgi:hypothetical protein